MEQRFKEQYQVENLANAWKFTHNKAAGLGVTAKREIEKAERLIDEALKISAKALGRKRK